MTRPRGGGSPRRGRDKVALPCPFDSTESPHSAAEVLQDVINMASFIQTRPLENGVFFKWHSGDRGGRETLLLAEEPLDLKRVTLFFDKQIRKKP